MPCPPRSLSSPVVLFVTVNACSENAYSNAGGGGERVLWTAVALMQRTEPDVISVVYSGDTDASKEQIIAKAKVRVRVTLRRYTTLTTSGAVGPVRYHVGSALASFCLPRVEVARRGPRMAAVHTPRAELGFHVPRMGGVVQVRPRPLHRCVTTSFPCLGCSVSVADTMGYAFTFHVVAWLAGIPVGAYVHYPTISTDMLARVEARRTTYANSNTISSSAALSRVKLM